MQFKSGNAFILLRTSALSAAISIGCVTAAFSMPYNDFVNDPINQSQNIQYYLSSFDAMQQRRMASKTTILGMKNQYDDSLGKSTFIWANETMIKPDMSRVELEGQAKFATDYYLSMVSNTSVDKGSVSNAKMAYMHDIGSGALIAKYKQEIGGVEVFNREINIAMIGNIISLLHLDIFHVLVLMNLI